MTLAEFQADLATLCDLEDSIAAATTFLRTWLTCTDCCLQLKCGLFRIEDFAVHTKMYGKVLKRGEGLYYTYSGR